MGTNLNFLLATIGVVFVVAVWVYRDTVASERFKVSHGLLCAVSSAYSLDELLIRLKEAGITHEIKREVEFFQSQAEDMLFTYVQPSSGKVEIWVLLNELDQAKSILDHFVQPISIRAS